MSSGDEIQFVVRSWQAGSFLSEFYLLQRRENVAHLSRNFALLANWKIKAAFQLEHQARSDPHITSIFHCSINQFCQGESSQEIVCASQVEAILLKRKSSIVMEK